MYACSCSQCQFLSEDVTVIENHIVLEHGVNMRNNYRIISEASDLSEITVKKKGQTVCKSCEISYNNRNRPEFCVCGENLSIRRPKVGLSSYRLSNDLFSVRKYPRGICKRVFVNVAENLCYSPDCMEKRALYDDLASFKCEHLDSCTMVASPQYAHEIKISFQKISHFIRCENTLTEVKKVCNGNDELVVYNLPDGYLVLPLLGKISYECGI